MDRRVAALTARIRGAREGDVTAVHQARVASRRLREALPVAAASASPRLVEKATRRVRRLTRALGPVREMDVTLGLLDGLAAERPGFAVAIAATRARAASEREGRRSALMRALRPAEVSATEDAVALVRDGLVRGDAAWRMVLARRIARRGAALRAAVDEAGVLYNIEAVHAVRIAAKKLRYALELAGELRAAPAARSVTHLKRVQDLLGHLHDLDVVAGLALAEVAAGSTPVLDESDAGFIEFLHAECREIHARYLAGRLRVVALADDAVSRIGVAVAGEPGVPALSSIPGGRAASGA
jgi:CHAD domain-containing protein